MKMKLLLQKNLLELRWLLRVNIEVGSRRKHKNILILVYTVFLLLVETSKKWCPWLGAILELYLIRVMEKSSWQFQSSFKELNGDPMVYNLEEAIAGTSLEYGFKSLPFGFSFILAKEHRKVHSWNACVVGHFSKWKWEWEFFLLIHLYTKQKAVKYGK